jgi:hypothetical protein
MSGRPLYQGTNGNNRHAILANVSVAGADDDAKQGGGSTFAGIDAFDELHQVYRPGINVTGPQFDFKGRPTSVTGFNNGIHIVRNQFFSLKPCGKESAICFWRFARMSWEH